jgi:DEAD/DEAH box helicase domain-containing protein
MRAVWSTNALELGIDIGTLDAVILDGYPGSRMETFQRAGRAGRGDNECLVFLVATDNPLDQHMVTHPEKLFDEQPERAVINPANKTILPDHVVCAANEHILSVDDEAHFGDTLPDVVTEAEAAGRLNRIEEQAGRWRCTEEQPAWEMRDRIRSIDERTITLEDQYSGEHVSSLGLGDALQDAHPGAIYAYQKDLYRVTEVDYDEDRAYLKSVDDKGQYTQPLQDKKITVHAEHDQDTLTGPAGGIQIGQADLTVSTVPTGYLEYTHGKDTEPIEYTYDEGEQPPSQDLRTDSLYLAIPDSVRTAALPAPLDSDSHYVDGLHAIEHAMISLLPQEVLCDRRDIGGLSTNYHEWTGTGSIFIHDGYEGGVGLSTAAYETLPSLLQSTHDLLSECQCDDGCPACIQSPHCGNGNRNLSKEHAITILRRCLLPDG